MSVEEAIMICTNDFIIANDLFSTILYAETFVWWKGKSAGAPTRNGCLFTTAPSLTFRQENILHISARALHDSLLSRLKYRLLLFKIQRKPLNTALEDVDCSFDHPRSERIVTSHPNFKVTSVLYSWPLCFNHSLYQ